MKGSCTKLSVRNADLSMAITKNVCPDLRSGRYPRFLMRLPGPVVSSFRMTPEIGLRTEDVRRIGP